jgi:predicted RNA-binding protein with PIN domain
MPFLIDGHNVIAALPDIDLEDPHDEAKLVLKLRAWTGHKRRKAIVVFDGGIPGGYSNALSTSAVRVIFAARHHSNADRIIRERLSRLPDAVNWMVVSSDHEVLDNARQIGAKVMTAQDFAEILNFEPDAWKEKPDAISAAEVEAWLQVFQQPTSLPSTKESAASSLAPPSSDEAQSSKATDKRRRRKKHGETPVRTTRTIGEQTGIEPEKPVSREPSLAFGEKPEEISSAEVDSWLEVFHDTPSHVPPPKPRPKPALRKPKPLVVNKDGELSEEDVESWLKVFSDAPEPPLEPPAPKTAKKTAKKSKSPSARLAKRKRNLVPTKKEDAGGLSPEDQALWQRMFGEEDR